MPTSEQPLSSNSASPEDEIRELEQRLQEKKRILADRGAEQTHEKTVLKEVLKERIEEARASTTDASVAPAPVAGTHVLPITDAGGSHATPGAGRTYTEEEKEEGVRTLIEIALSRSIEDAVRMAESETPWFIDELHDLLVDQFYDKLLALRKIEKL